MDKDNAIIQVIRVCSVCQIRTVSKTGNICSSCSYNNDRRQMRSFQSGILTIKKNFKKEIKRNLEISAIVHTNIDEIEKLKNVAETTKKAAIKDFEKLENIQNPPLEEMEN